MKDVVEIQDRLVLKIRPHCHEFLSSLSSHYLVYMYTAARREYVKRILPHIDPTGEIFGDRIITKDDSTFTTVKMSGFIFKGEYLSHMTIIVDDRKDAWDEFDQANVLQCEPFLHIWNKRGGGYVVKKHDDELLRVREKLLQIHDSFYNSHIDVPSSLRS